MCKVTPTILGIIPKVKAQLTSSLEIIENENLKKIIGGRINNSYQQIFKELRENIKLDNSWATFYLIQILAEMIVNSIIKKENEYLKKEINQLELIKKRIENHSSTLGKKLEVLRYLKKSYRCNTKDFETFIKIIELLNKIRNRFMFHITNYDQYSFIYEKDNLFLKDELLKKDFKELKDKIDSVMNEFREETLEWCLLERYSTPFGHTVENFEKLIEQQKSGKRKGRMSVNNAGICSPLPEMLTKISFIFLLFFGKNDLKLFTSE